MELKLKNPVTGNDIVIIAAHNDYKMLKIGFDKSGKAVYSEYEVGGKHCESGDASLVVEFLPTSLCKKCSKSLNNQLHKCPFLMDVHDDHTLCDCCDDCMCICSEDI
jgi:hypothetical protein